MPVPVNDADRLWALASACAPEPLDRAARIPAGLARLPGEYLLAVQGPALVPHLALTNQRLVWLERGVPRALRLAAVTGLRWTAVSRSAGLLDVETLSGARVADIPTGPEGTALKDRLRRAAVAAAELPRRFGPDGRTVVLRNLDLMLERGALAPEEYVEAAAAWR